MLTDNEGNHGCAIAPSRFEALDQLLDLPDLNLRSQFESALYPVRDMWLVAPRFRSRGITHAQNHKEGLEGKCALTFVSASFAWASLILNSGADSGEQNYTREVEADREVREG